MSLLNILIVSVVAFSPVKQHTKTPHKKHHKNHHVIIKSNIDIVTVTTYKVNEFKNDINGDKTATGMKLTTDNPRQHRIIAISWDLKKKYKFGQWVKIEGAGIYDGKYVVKDLMNKRWKKRIDILINPEDKQMKYKKVKIFKL
jgi:3D (Asp-Asp-Asp) domain-containing protein